MSANCVTICLIAALSTQCSPMGTCYERSTGGLHECSGRRQARQLLATRLQLIGDRFYVMARGLIPKEVRRFCFVRSPEHFVSSGNVISDMIVSQAGKLFGKTKPVGSLARSIAEQNLKNTLSFLTNPIISDLPKRA